MKKEVVAAICAGGVLALGAILQGCAAVVAAGAAAGAAAGTVSYLGNELCVSRETTVDKAWDAAHAAMKELQFVVISTESYKDATGGVLRGRNAKDQPVLMKFTRQSGKLTEIRIRVGTFNTKANRDAAQLLYNTMSPRL